MHQILLIVETAILLIFKIKQSVPIFLNISILAKMAISTIFNEALQKTLWMDSN
jgi:hypothetical protein